MKEGHLTKETEAMVCAAQKQSIWVNSIKYHIDGQDVSPMCRLSGKLIDREEKTWYIVDFAIPMDHHVKEKEKEKINKYMHLGAEVRRQFRVKTVIVPTVLGAFQTVSAKLSESLKKLEIQDIIGNL